jgi:hypothetical protein
MSRSFFALDNFMVHLSTTTSEKLSSYNFIGAPLAIDFCASKLILSMVGMIISKPRPSSSIASDKWHIFALFVFVTRRLFVEHHNNVIVFERFVILMVGIRLAIPTTRMSALTEDTLDFRLILVL